MSNSENPKVFIPSKLKLLKKVAKGSFGCVYDATYKNIPVVVKSSLEEKKNMMLVKEYKYLKILQSNNFCGIPKLSYTFTKHGKRCFIMEKLGIDLSRLVKKATNKQFSLQTTLKIALQVLERLKYVHSCGITHNDIKSSNLITGPNNKINFINKIYLIDFGAATSYLNEGDHILETKADRIRGTWRYCSVNSLKRRSLSRRDDLESLAYLLVKLRSGKLPWDALLRNKMIPENKRTEKLLGYKSVPAKYICVGMEDEFKLFLDEVRKLGFTEKPDYDKYHKRFEKLLNEVGSKADEPIDWSFNSHKPLCVLSE